MDKNKIFLLLLLTVSTAMGLNNPDWKAAAALEKHPGTETVNVKKLKATGDTLQFEYSIPEAVIRKGEGSSVTIQLGNAINYGKEGEPILPLIPVEVIIPSGKKIDNIKITALKQSDLSGNYQIDYQKAYTPLMPGVKARESKPRADIYNSDNPFPGQQGSIVTVQKKHGITIAIISVNPLIYHPHSGKVTLIKNLRLEVFTRPQKTLSGEWAFPERFDTNTTGVENPEALETYRSTSSAPLNSIPSGLCNPAENYSYVIVTSRAIRDATTDVTVRDLIAQRQANGITATIVTIEDVLATYTGVDNAEKLRNFIKDAYTNWKTQYVLLGGDINIIPERQLYSTGDGGMEIPSDLYFQCLDGNFNSDNDALWGETTDGPGGTDVDLAAEVYIGRASAETPTEMSNFVYKTLKYENSSPSEHYIYNALMCGEYLGFGGVSDYAKPSMEEIHLGSSENGYTTAGFASCPTMSVSTLYAPDTAWTATNLISRINSNNFSIINHLGHANDYTVMQLSIANVDGLTNTNPIFLYTQGCYPGNFENDCIAEHFTTSTRNGLYGGVLNSRYGWGAGYSTDGPSQRFDRQFWDAYFGENILNIGKMNADSHEDNLWGITDDIIRWCYYETNLFGDPYTIMKGKVNGPLVSYSSHTFGDSTGNNDGIINPGEKIGLHVSLTNNGTESAESVSASLSSSDPYVTIIQNNSTYGTIPCCGSNQWSTSDYILQISPSCPTPHSVNLQLHITDADTNSWNSTIPLQVYTSCTLSGSVKTLTGALPVANAVITYTGPIHGTINTDANGNFSLNVIDGTYSVSAQGTGYLASQPVSVTVPPNASVNILLQKPVLGISDTAINAIALIGETTDQQITVSNRGDGILQYSLAAIDNTGVTDVNSSKAYDESHFLPLVKGAPDTRIGLPVKLGSGGPDHFGYRWSDSKTHGGPSYTWTDISTSGRLLSSVSSCDDCFESAELSFPFKFYGNSYTTIYVGSNGYITFGSGSTSYSNYPLPSSSAPPNLIAAFFDDLSTSSTGDVYFKDFGDCAVIQFNNVAPYSGSGSFTFQIVLRANGVINFYYKTMTGTLTSSTTGIQNSVAGDGLTVAYNTTYISDSLAVEIKSAPGWLSMTPAADSCGQSESKSVQLHFNTSGMNSGIYRANIQVTHNDPNAVSPRIIPVTFTVQDYPPSLISGTVKSFTGNRPLSDAVINYSGPSSGTVHTDASGNFSFSAIHGTYTITARADGYLVSQPITAVVPQDTVISFFLKKPILHLSDTSINQVVSPGQTADFQLSVTNPGDTLLGYSIVAIDNNTLQNFVPQHTYDKSHFIAFNKGDPDNRVGMPVTLGYGGPDRFGYRWKDSNTPGGPVYTWEDISSTGRQLSTVSGCDDCYETAALSFPFKFYGNTYTSIYVGSNGYVTFGSGNSGYSNYSLPSTSAPANMAAAFFDDLNTSSGGDIYFKDFGDHAVIQYNNVAPYSGTGSFTFQIVLRSSGVIDYYYKTMSGTLTSATVGIQNSFGNDGLTVAYNTSYIRNSFAVELSSTPAWITSAPLIDSCAPGSSKIIQVHFDASVLDTGTYHATLQISHNDPTTVSPKNIPVTLTVQNNELPIIVRQPDDTTVISGLAAMFSITATGSSLSYQWQRNGIDIPGATGASIIIMETNLADDGTQYRCIVRNLAGTVISNNATLHVHDGAPEIVLQPHDTTVTIGQTAAFSVEASGTGLVYQWQRNGVNIPGASHEQYNLINAQMADNDAGFRCIVSNTFGSMTSNTAYLTVTQPITKIVQILSVGTSGTSIAHGTRMTAENVNIGGIAAGLVKGNRFKLFLK